jgi:PUA-domain protein
LLIKKRHPLSSKDIKGVLEYVGKTVPEMLSHIDKKKIIELVELADGEKVYLQNGKPIIVEHGGKMMPALSAAPEVLNSLPKAVVDMGAIPFVAKGADVMAPGIRTVSDGVKVGDVVLVVDEKYGKGLAIGILIMEREEVLKKAKGKAIKNIHHVGDEIWNGMQSLL